MILHGELTKEIIGAAIEVHRALGPGLLESAYRACLCEELRLRGLQFGTEVKLPVMYKGIVVDVGYRMDVVVEDRVVLELKAVEKVTRIYEAQLLTHLRLSGHRVGLLINFNVPVLKDGITRRIL
jgi:GxxExxY protein